LSIEQDAADLHAGSGRWAYSPAGQSALARRHACSDPQAVSQALDGNLGLWAKHKARCHLRETYARLDNARQTWEGAGQPDADQLDALRNRLSAKAAHLEEVQRAHDSFFANHPENPRRLADLDHVTEHQRALERRRSFEVLLERVQASSRRDRGGRPVD
jgi:hypothetical protein